MKTRNTNHVTYFQAAGSVVGRTAVIVGDGSYDGHYEEIDSCFWLETLGVRKRCLQADVAEFIRSTRPTDCAGLAFYYSDVLNLGRLIRSDSPLFDWLPAVTGLATCDPEFVGELLQFWTYTVPDNISSVGDRTRRVLEYRVSPETSSVASQTVVWKDTHPYSPSATA